MIVFGSLKTSFKQIIVSVQLLLHFLLIVVEFLKDFILLPLLADPSWGLSLGSSQKFFF